MDDLNGMDLIPIITEIVPELKDSKPGDLNSTELPKLKNVICLSETNTKYSFAHDFIELFNYSTDYDTNLINDLKSAVTPDDTLVLLLTSGTTSFPKPAITTHRTFAAVSGLSDAPSYFGVNWLLQRNAPDESIRFLLMVPNWHNSATLMLSLSMVGPFCLHMIKAFDPSEVLKTIEREKIQHTFGFGLHFRMLAAHKNFDEFDLSSLVVAITGHDPSDYEMIRDKFGVKHQLNVYGATEAGTVVMGLLPPNSTRDPNKLKNSYGRVPTWIDVKIKDVETGKELPIGEIGEICIKGPYIFSGYYNLPDETSAGFDDEGYFHMGDIGHLDEENFIYWDGRLKDVVKSGGENVSALEVEKFLEMETPFIRTAAVVGVPDQKWQEAVTAVVSLMPEYEKEGKITPEEIIQFCKGKIAGYKIPKHIIVINHEKMAQYFLLLGKRDKGKIRPLALEKLGIKEDA